MRIVTLVGANNIDEAFELLSEGSKFDILLARNHDKPALLGEVAQSLTAASPSLAISLLGGHFVAAKLMEHNHGSSIRNFLLGLEGKDQISLLMKREFLHGTTNFGKPADRFDNCQLILRLVRGFPLDTQAEILEKSLGLALTKENAQEILDMMAPMSLKQKASIFVGTRDNLATLLPEQVYTELEKLEPGQQAEALGHHMMWAMSKARMPIERLVEKSPPDLRCDVLCHAPDHFINYHLSGAMTYSSSMLDGLTENQIETIYAGVRRWYALRMSEVMSNNPRAFSLN
jgi:hypothetical protein